MGGCCCSSRKPQLHGTPVYYYYPPESEEHESLTSHNGAILSSGLLVDLNLNSSTPDTFRAPPAPIPYDVVLGRPQSTDVGFNEPTFPGGNLEKPKSGFCPVSPRKSEVEFVKSKKFNVSTMEEEEACPTCLEEYDDENPKIITKCNHHFHLSCILEWMERSDSCPICNKEMIYEAL